MQSTVYRTGRKKTWESALAKLPVSKKPRSSEPGDQRYHDFFWGGGVTVGEGERNVKILKIPPNYFCDKTKARTFGCE